MFLKGPQIFCGPFAFCRRNTAKNPMTGPVHIAGLEGFLTSMTEMGYDDVLAEKF